MPGPDILRCVAAILVIAIHASAWPFSQYNGVWKASLIIDSFSRCAVPLFFMLTGYFLLCGKQETLSQFISKRFLRIFLPFVMLVFIYGCFKDYTITELIRRAFVQGDLDFHLWYIYTIIGIYIFIPIVKVLFLCKEYKLINYYLFIWFLTFILYASFQSLFNINTNPFSVFNLYYFQGWLGYVILGGLLRVVLESKIQLDQPFEGFNLQILYKLVSHRIARFVPFFIYILSSSIIALGTYILSIKQGRPIEIFFSSNNFLVFIQSVSLFVSLISLNYYPRIFGWVAQYTYWIYLIHILCLSFVVKHIDLSHFSFINIPLAILFTFIISLFFSIPLLSIEKFFLKIIKR